MIVVDAAVGQMCRPWASDEADEAALLARIVLSAGPWDHVVFVEADDQLSQVQRDLLSAAAIPILTHWPSSADQVVAASDRAYCVASGQIHTVSDVTAATLAAPPAPWSQLDTDRRRQVLALTSVPGVGAATAAKWLHEHTWSQLISTTTPTGKKGQNLADLRAQVVQSYEQLQGPVSVEPVRGQVDTARLYEVLAGHSDVADQIIGVPIVNVQVRGGGLLIDGQRPDDPATLLADPAIAKSTNDTQRLATYCHQQGWSLAGVRFDEALAAHLVEGMDGQASVVDKLQAAGLSDWLRQVEIPTAVMLAQMSAVGIGADRGQLDDIARQWTQELQALNEHLENAAGRPVNVNSPAEVAQFLYDERRLSAQDTKSETLQGLIEQDPIVADIMTARSLGRLVGQAEALARSVHDGRIHSHFEQMGTRTGRLTSSGPNLQNIPARTEQGRHIRRAFLADAGQLFITADYSQLELRIMAALSGDRALSAALIGDVHTQIAAKVADCPAQAVTREQRTAIKAVTYGLAYGMSVPGLAKRLGITQGAAGALRRDYLAAFPDLKAWMDDSVERARSRGFAETVAGRRRYLPELSGHGPARATAQRQALNTPIQGSAADIVKMAMLTVGDYLAGIGGQVLLQIHDELVIQVPEQGAEQAVKTIDAQLRHVPEQFLGAPAAVNIGLGRTWFEADHESSEHSSSVTTRSASDHRAQRQGDSP